MMRPTSSITPAREPGPRISPLEALAGKQILLIGTTGFLAKVMLAMLLERFSAKKIYCLIRSTPSKTAQQRLWDEVLSSECLEPLVKSFGDAFKTFVDAQVEAVSGDISKPNLGMDDETFKRLTGELDVVINSAGLVDFNPPLDTALEINTIGADEVAKFCMAMKVPRLVHISTCFVAGARSGHIREDAPIVGYFPKEKDLDGITISWEREVKDLQKEIQVVKGRTEDAALESKFRHEALDRLKEEGRETHERTVRAAITNQRRRWQAEELVRIGIDRAQHWGWPNIYTYTKSLGEQAIASKKGLHWAIVRPAIVESSMVYPFPGWNEGMNTSAPLAYLGIHGQIVYPGNDDLILDVIPVDYVASSTIAATAALFAGETEKVYQCASGDVNPCSMARVITLVGLYKRRYWRRQEAEGKASKLKALWNVRSEAVPRSRTQYELLGAPAMRNLVRGARKLLDKMEPERYGPLSGVVSEAKKTVKDAETDLDRVVEIFDIFMPFIWENKYVFRTNQLRDVFGRMNEADRALLPFDSEGIDWKSYWLDIHLPGLEKWVFPDLEPTGPKRISIPRNYRDLAEMFEARTQEHGRRVAFRLLAKDDVADTFTYRDVRRAAHAVADFLEQKGIKRGDRVLLVSEGRPGWGTSYFGILLAGATVVPIDVDLSAKEIANIARASGAKGAIASPKMHAKLLGLPPPGEESVKNGETALVASEGFPVTIWKYEEVFARAHELGEPKKRAARKPEDIASIIFTSGTTGKPKGVLLTDRNFTALTARMQALFELNHTDSLLSVLPPHHTFEFSAGLLMPLASGASITYLEERTPELITRAFEETPVTALIGVPAVWESLHRKIDKELKNQGKVVEAIVRGLMAMNRWIRDSSRWNVGRWIFRPMHDAFGGRLRYMVSGGAPLKPALFKDLYGMGFNIYEGYGLTEASPVLTVGWPRMKTPPGSVGWPLPGIEVRIHQADENGVGEVIARGPTIMDGYLDNPEATAQALRDGWLFTGDQGRLDDEGRLFIVGRQKDVIIDTGGKNIYPDEIEEIYTGSPFVKEISVVGIPAERGTGERVAALVVPDYEAKEIVEQDLTKEEVRERIREHFREVGSKLPLPRRVKVLHTWEADLPRTSTKKIKRPYVKEQILRLERAIQVARGNDAAAEQLSREGRQELAVRRTIAAIAQRDLSAVRPEMRLTDTLGFDSLMQLELLTALETEFPHAGLTGEDIQGADTVGDVIRIISRDKVVETERVEEVGNREEARPLHVPSPVAALGKALLGRGQKLLYGRAFDVTIDGEGNIPANRNFIVAANHSSHLDMGLVKYALGDFGKGLRTLAAKDYFFDDEMRRIYFENFTNLLPIDRHGSLKKSLRLASAALREGSSLLIFPEGTRARDGVMTSFKPSIGYLALADEVDILPMFLGGTHAALPVGGVVPKERDLYVRIGAPFKVERIREQTKGMSKSAAYRWIAEQVEAEVRRLGGLPPREEDDTKVRVKRALEEGETLNELDGEDAARATEGNGDSTHQGA
ncbi:AMP-binding protein [Myxococcota bacterium]|nr:AMP-binding protein [Myxococcota bacterium]